LRQEPWTGNKSGKSSAIAVYAGFNRGKPVGVTRMGKKLVAWRDSGGKVTLMHDLCPHRGVALSVGEVHSDCIGCPFHGFEYGASGRCTLIPANGKARPVPGERTTRA
jgi:phenylpropionate dioxygenase-like ring-hydroxylating dioxygenase large terminal subunit